MEDDHKTKKDFESSLIKFRKLKEWPKASSPGSPTLK